MSHPQSCREPNCTLSYREHLLSISYTSAAMPSRMVTRTPNQPDEPTAQTNIREKRWERDMGAFQRLLKDGYMPKQMEGSALREKQGETRYDIEERPVTIDYSDPR